MTREAILAHLATKFNCRAAKVGFVHGQWSIALGYRDNRRVGEEVHEWAYGALGSGVCVCAEDSSLG